MNNFTPDSTAILLIDHQVGTLQLVQTQSADQVRRTTIVLAETAKKLGIPVVLSSSQEDRVQGPLIPELAQILPDAFALRIRREGMVNAWLDPVFRAAVAATGRRNLVMAGITTDVCLVFPAISAVEEGYRVQAVLDASGSPFATSENAARRRMEKAGVILTATNTLIAELAQDWSSDTGKSVLPILFDFLPAIISSRSVTAPS